MKIAVKSLEVAEKASLLDPCKLGNAPTTAIPSGHWPTLEVESISKNHCSSTGRGWHYQVHSLFLDTVARGACEEDLWHWNLDTAKLTSKFLFKHHIHKAFYESHTDLCYDSGCFSKLPGKGTYSRFLKITTTTTKKTQLFSFDKCLLKIDAVRVK
jgi:hypothetical protein